MAAPLVWTAERDAIILGLRAQGRSWDAIAAALGISRWAAIERGRRLGARKPATVRRAPQLLDFGRPALAAGHPVTWGALTAGTVLDCTLYPFPPLGPVEHDDEEPLLRLPPFPHEDDEGDEEPAPLRRAA